MCLSINSNVTINFNENDEAIAYKVFTIAGNHLHSHVQNQIAKEDYVADKIVKKETQVYNAIHVFLDRSNVDVFSLYGIPVKCICKKEDLVATGYFYAPCGVFKSAAFSKVKLVPPDGYYINENGEIEVEEVILVYPK